MNPRNPNLIFLFADQLGLNHLGYAGNPRARTPRIDRMARDGVNFVNAVSTMPVCAAYRASLFTGKYPTTTGMVINELRMNPDHECFAHVLTRAGYETGYIGKWHLYANELGNHLDPENSFVPPGPHRLGFDGYWAAYNFHHNYYNAYYHTDSMVKILYGPDEYEPDAQTDMAVAFVKRRRRSGRPFALFLSFGTPHDPWVRGNVPERFWSRFEGVEFPAPANYREENDPYADRWGRMGRAERRALPLWRRCYYAMTANLDWNLGRLMDAVDADGAGQDTIIVFTSDHGEMFGAQGRRAKNIFYEEAVRVPFLIRWPGVLAGRISDACLGTVDIMPTLLSLMGLEAPLGIEGMDLSRCASGESGPEPDAAFLQNTGACACWEDGYEWRALRDKRYTYAVYRRDGRELLFDNVNDPCQTKNLADQPPSREELHRFRDMMREKMAGLNDAFERSTWYRDHWTDGSRIILRGSGG